MSSKESNDFFLGAQQIKKYSTKRNAYLNFQLQILCLLYIYKSFKYAHRYTQIKIY